MSRTRSSYVICVEAPGVVDLLPWKVYRLRPDSQGADLGLLRVEDESGEDYLYPQRWFMPLDLPEAIRRRLRARRSLASVRPATVRRR